MSKNLLVMTHPGHCTCFICLDEIPPHPEMEEKIRQDVEDEEVHEPTTKFLAYAQRELFRRAT